MKQLTAKSRALWFALGALTASLVFGAVSAGECVADGSCDVRVRLPVLKVEATPAPAVPLKGLAIIGDSTQDEYQANNPRGGDYVATTFNWVELLARYRGVNVGPWGERPEPRREGYEYNWARSAATTKTMIEDGQHTGVAEQIRAGKVSHVLIQIGINDFYQQDFWQDIVERRLTSDELHTRVDAMAANIDTAVRTLKEAGNPQIMLVAMQDYATPNLLPEVRVILADPVKRERLIDAFAYLNQQLEQIARREQVVFFDYNAALQAELARRVDRTNHIAVGGELIDLSERGNEPHHAFLGDEYAHPGTVLSAIMANLYIEKMNTAFGTTIAPFSDQEMVRIAGIQP